MTSYERSCLQRLCDIAEAGGVPREEHFRECCEIIGRILFRDVRQERDAPFLSCKASRKIIDAAKRMGCQPMPGDSVESVLLQIAAAEAKRHR